MTNVLAVIPARGGSKSVPRKNLRAIGGKPLIAWSLEAAHTAALVGYVAVSSDDDEVLDVAASVWPGPFRNGEGQGFLSIKRPAELATDEATTDSVMVHALTRAQETLGEAFDLVVLLQPTVPVRAPGLVDACIEHFLAAQARPYGQAPNSLLTCYRLHFVWHRWKEYSPWMTNSILRPRRQDLPLCDERWAEDGSVYVTRAEQLLGKGRRIVEPVEVFETTRSVDIDSEEDLLLADALLRARVRQPLVSDAPLSPGCPHEAEGVPASAGA